ncbi:universal stress protein [Rhodococcus sp. MS16]|uniref:universal stress protein n=1 Tax=Rhodococcus sp. MS16 TaxID=2579941 RepID=UPI0015628CD3|nr:universal stress protein [Rhodococcus sp. MS16]NRI67674.1 universal stress protein [Rhodococcus sp. MS16]
MNRNDHETDDSPLVLAGVDGSDSSWRAAAYAAGLARRQQSLLVVVYVQPITSAFANLSGTIVDAGQEIADELLTYIQRSTARLGASEQIRWQFRTLRGDPANELIRIADELHADAIVVGSSASFGHRIYGSVAIRLVKTGRWPVTVVP